MESNYSNRDFEQFVKQNADEYRMFPSEKVWSGVNNALHTRRRWTGFGLAFLLLLTGGAVSWVMTMYPVSKKSEDIASVKAKAGSNELAASGEEVMISAPSTQEKKPVRKLHGLLPFSKEPEQTTTSTGTSFQPAAEEITADQSRQPVTDNLPSSAAPVNSGLIERVEKINTPIRAGRNRSAEPAGTAAIAITAAESMSSPAATAAINEKEMQATAPVNITDAPLTIESVTNSYKREKVRKKISWQLFVTPTVSYRKLGVNKAFNNTAGTGYPFSPALTDVNQAVTHKPDLGLQLGFTAAYPLTKSIKVRAGLQFNVNRYDIKAFSYTGEMATIGLNGPATGNSSVSAYTRYRNYSGYKADWLKNFYYSVSMPIGAELKVLGNQKTSFGIAGTIQPTYMISDGAYLLSTDYKNYAKVPWLTRNFNMSTGFEAFINYKRGNTRWQVGPQFRYQLLSSFENKYPVKENLFDFGVKIGVMLNE